MIAGAINGMLDTLNDQGHTRYDTAEQYRQEVEQQSGEYQGIGAYVNQEGDLIVIVAPIEGSPAEAAGIEAGDIILAVDGVPTDGKTSAEVAQEIRGEPGTDVTITVRHLDQEEEVDITVTRGEIKVPAVTWTMLPDNTAHIKLSQFSEKATDEMKQALAEAKEQGAEQLILDLRNNPGGLLEQAIGVTSQFLPEGEVVLRVRGRDGEEEVRTANEPSPETELPMVVLINSGSASSSEIFAGALQDHKRATVVGVDTVGLGTVISPRELDDGSAVYIGIAEWLTPEQPPLAARGRSARYQGDAGRRRPGADAQHGAQAVRGRDLAHRGCPAQARPRSAWRSGGGSWPGRYRGAVNPEPRTPGSSLGLKKRKRAEAGWIGFQPSFQRASFLQPRHPCRVRRDSVAGTASAPVASLLVSFVARLRTAANQVQ